MARIPQSFIDELIARVDIVELIDSRVPLKKTGREFGACCPFHNEKTPSFTVSPQKQFYHCFGCGAHGTALSFVMEFDRLEFPDAVRVLADMVGLEVPVEQGDGGARGKPATPLYELMASAADFYRQTLKQMPHAIDYLKDRGLSGETAADYGIGFAPDGWDFVLGRLGGDEEANRQLARCGLVVRGDGDRLYDRFRNRVMFPIRDARGRTIAFGGRVIDKGEPKYLNSPETVLFQKGRELYGLFEVRQASRDIKRLLVVEGYMDVVALAEHGINYAVATLGTAATVEHFKRLFRVTDEVIFCFDGDRAGRQAAWRAVNNALYSLYEGREIKILFLPDGEDPDSLVQKDGAQALEELIDKSEPCLHYILEEISKRTGNAGRAEREKFGKELAGMFSHIPDEKLRDTFQDMVDKAYGLDAGKLGRQIAEKITKPAGNRPPDGMAVQKTPVRQVLMYLLH
ncbi:MAG: DNA primase, partial [Gammaproteobacteria bacterium]|nr:DNA primase [Gammaproteobacteria bacterium]